MESLGTLYLRPYTVKRLHQSNWQAQRAAKDQARGPNCGVSIAVLFLELFLAVPNNIEPLAIGIRYEVHFR